MAAIVVRIRTIGPIRTICPKWSDFWSEFGNGSHALHFVTSDFGFLVSVTFLVVWLSVDHV